MEQELNVLIPEAALQAKVSELASRIAMDYAGKHPLLVGVLKGAWVFLADLVRQVPFSVEVDFIKVSSYGKSTESSGEVRFEMDLSRPLEGKDILLVEDIIDTGVTIRHLKEALLARNPASLKLVVLLDKAERREVEVDIDYTGFVIPNHFVVGYGLDCAEFGRNLPHVAALTPEQADRLTGKG
ncbi:MAG: hypoxanthine phosphoribosyltransferase [Planctomycetota bacterium]|jgi:hypoxanthine phosphoribosyltransferase